jgi:peroxiredoxin
MKQVVIQPTRWAGTLAVSLSLMLLLIVASPTLGQQDIPELPSPNGAGETPEMIIPMLSAGPMKLSSLRGKVLVIDFFRSTCPHCQQHAPHMAELYNQFRARGLQVLGLAGDQPEESASVRAFIKQYKIAYPIGFITNETIAYYADSHDHGVPQMVLFGADGKLARRWIGWDEKTGKDMIAAVQEQLQKAPAPKPAAKPGAKSSVNSQRRRSMATR